MDWWNNGMMDKEKKGMVESWKIGTSSDPLDNRTAWFYTQYLNNIFTDAIAVQLAIWRIEQEFDVMKDGNLTLDGYRGYAYLGTAIINQATNYYNDADTHSSFSGNVGVLNLYHYDHQTRIQDQSQLVPVPESGTILLLGSGLLGLALLTRLRKRIA